MTALDGGHPPQLNGSLTLPATPGAAHPTPSHAGLKREEKSLLGILLHAVAVAVLPHEVPDAADWG